MIFCEVEIASRNGFDRLRPYIDVLQQHRPLLTVLQHETKLLLWEKDDSYPFCHVSTTSRSRGCTLSSETYISKTDATCGMY